MDLKQFRRYIFFLCVVASIFLNGEVIAQESTPRIQVEVFLAGDQKRDAEVVRAQFKALSIQNVRFQFFRAGRPPANVAIGRQVPGTVARLALEMAIEYNMGVKFLLPQELLPLTWIGIGTSAFDEQNQIPVSAEAIQKLRDPALSTEAFHSLYRRLTARQR